MLRKSTSSKRATPSGHRRVTRCACSSQLSTDEVAFPFGLSSPNGYSLETLAAMSDAVNGRVSGPYKPNEEMWAAVFDDDGEQ